MTKNYKRDRFVKRIKVRGKDKRRKRRREKRGKRRKGKCIKKGEREKICSFAR